MNAPDVSLRWELSRIAADLYVANGRNVTFAQVADAAGRQVSDIRAAFPNKTIMLGYRYSGIPAVFEHHMAALQSYPDFTIGEKVAQFLYSTFDYLNETREFTDATFTEWNLAPFRKQTAQLFARMVEQDSRIPFVNRFLLRDLTYDAAAWQVVCAVRHWLDDPSEGTADTLAWVEKSTAFAQEILYSGILDKGLDLGRYAMSSLKRNTP
jgi:AcrR family transcriptional regulator